MIPGKEFIQHLVSKDIRYFTGVPDSLLKELISEIGNVNNIKHRIAVNEGAALAMAAGAYMASQKIPVVYLQNSGLGNLVNPLTSLHDPEVYSLPVLLLIGWRGRPGIKDEPQHVKMGRITEEMLNTLELPYQILLSNGTAGWKQQIDELISIAGKEKRPVALLIGENVFTGASKQTEQPYTMDSETAIRLLYQKLNSNDIVICTTGKIGRVFYKIHISQKKINRYFLNVGSMGHAASIAAGIGENGNEKVVVIDGDGSLLMHTGALASISKLNNICYIVLNNGSHQSVGAQPTAGFEVDFCTIARGFGFAQQQRVDNISQLDSISSLAMKGFFEIRINNHTCNDLPRPEQIPSVAVREFMKQLKVG